MLAAMEASAKTDQELRRQLEQASNDGQEVQAVLALRQPEAAAQFLSPEQTQQVVEDLVTRVRMQTGEAPRDYHVFRNLGSFVVAAPPAVINHLVQQDEVASAVANRQPEGVVAPPRSNGPR